MTVPSRGFHSFHVFDHNAAEEGDEMMLEPEYEEKCNKRWSRMNIPSELHGKFFEYFVNSNEGLIQQINGECPAISNVLSEVLNYQEIVLKRNVDAMKQYVESRMVDALSFPLGVERFNIEYSASWFDGWERQHYHQNPVMYCSLYHNGALCLPPVQREINSEVRSSRSNRRKSLMSQSSRPTSGLRSWGMKKLIQSRSSMVDFTSSSSKMLDSRQFNTLFQGYKTDNVQEALMRSMVIVLGLNHQGMSQLQELIELCGSKANNSAPSVFGLTLLNDIREVLPNEESFRKPVRGMLRQNSPTSTHSDDSSSFSSVVLTNEEKKRRLILSLGDFSLCDQEYRLVTQGILKLFCPFLEDASSITALIRPDISVNEFLNHEQETGFWDEYRDWLMRASSISIDTIPILSFLSWILPFMHEVTRFVTRQRVLLAYAMRNSRLKKNLTGLPHGFALDSFDANDENGVAPENRVGSMRFSSSSMRFQQHFRPSLQNMDMEGIAIEFDGAEDEDSIQLGNYSAVSFDMYQDEGIAPLNHSVSDSFDDYDQPSSNRERALPRLNSSLTSQLATIYERDGEGDGDGEGEGTTTNQQTSKSHAAAKQSSSPSSTTSFSSKPLRNFNAIHTSRR